MTSTLARVAAACAATFALAASPAVAGESESISTDRGSVEFEHYGEILRAEAGPYAGGYGIRAYLTWTDNGDKKTHVTALQGADGTGSASKNLSIREGTTVYLKMCYTNLQNEDVKCSRRQRGVA